jgi:hypothetical protein
LKPNEARLLDRLHKIMLIGLTEALYLVYKLLILLALDADGDGEATHSEGRLHGVVLCNGLEVGDIETAGRFLEYIGEVLCHEPVQTLQGAKA